MYIYKNIVELKSRSVFPIPSVVDRYSNTSFIPSSSILGRIFLFI